MRAVAPLPHAQRATIGRGRPAAVAGAGASLAVNGQLLELTTDHAVRHRHVVQPACLLGVVDDERLQRRQTIALQFSLYEKGAPVTRQGQSVTLTQPLMRWP